MRRHLITVSTALIFLQAGSMTVLAAVENPRPEQVQFPKGECETMVTGRLDGDAMVDYKVQAGTGQRLTIVLSNSNPSNYFNVLPPESVNVAMYIGQSGEDCNGILPSDGDYTVRFYLMRSAARRGESSDYTITIRLDGEALAPLPASQDAVLPGTPYHASASITCVPAPYLDRTPATRKAFVIRRGTDGTATVEISQTETMTRRILFVHRRPMVSDSPELMTVEHAREVTTIRFESGEYYEIPDAVLFGG